MVGLTVILETRKVGVRQRESTRQVLNKATAMINNINPSVSLPSSSSSSSFSRRRNSGQFQTPTFLDRCFLCGQKLLPGKDIYMYGGDKGFCSVECRCRQMFMDEEESILKGNCSLAAMKPENAATPPSSSSDSSSGSRHHKASRSHAGGFAY